MDKLTVAGISKRIDGDYDCDVVGMIDVSSDEALTVREAHFVKNFSGARGGEIAEAFLAGDMAVRTALASIVLARNDIPLLESTLWEAKAGWARFELSYDEAEETASPPTVEGETPSQIGGNSSSSTSDRQDDDQSPTDHRVSLKSVGSPPETLAS